MSYDMVQEDVPAFIKRVGDLVYEGSNNTVVVLGRDRAKKGVATVKDGLGSSEAPDGGKGAGAYHVIVGRQDKAGNPDFDKDRAYMYLSQKTEVDKNMGTLMEGDQGQVSAGILKADAARIVVRKDIKIVFDGEQSYIHLNGESCTIKIQNSGFIKVEKGKIVVDGDRVELGDGASEKVILGNKFQGLFKAHTHPTTHGPSGPPIQPMDDSFLSSRTVFVK